MAQELSRTEKLAAASLAMLDMAHRLYRMIQELPSIHAQYTELAEQFFFIPICLENLHKTVTTTKISIDGDDSKYSKLADDIDKLLGFLEQYHDVVDDSLPERFDDEIEYELPYQTNCLIPQIQGTESAANMILAILNLGLAQDRSTDETSEAEKEPTLLSRRRLLAETSISSVKGVIRTLMFNMPIPPRNEKSPPSPMYKRHLELKEWLETLLGSAEAKLADNAEDSSEDDRDNPSEGKKDEKLGSIDLPDEPKMGKIHTIGRNARADGMPPGIPYDPHAVYIRINRKYLDKRTLVQHGLPWSIPTDDPEYFIIWQSLTIRECDDLFDHTKRIRLLEKHSQFEPKSVVDALLKHWLDAEPVTPKESELSKGRAKTLEQFEKDLADLKAGAEEPARVNVRQPVSFHPPPPPPARSARPWKGMTDYWTPWTNDSWSLFSSLKRAGWKPVYMRGSDAGQTWFHGDRVVHVRRFKEDYTPQDGPTKTESLTTSGKQYLIIGKEWVEEEAILRSGFHFRALKDSWALDPRVTWFDIDILTAATSAFREERMFRKYRNLPGGDLHGSLRLQFPDEDYLQGPGLSSFPPTSSANFSPTLPRHECQPIEMTPSPYHPTRLDDVIEEAPVHEVPATDPRSPAVDSHDSFVEVEK